MTKPHYWYNRWFNYHLKLSDRTPEITSSLWYVRLQPILRVATSVARYIATYRRHLSVTEC